MTEQTGPVDPDQELLLAFKELDILVKRHARIKARIDEINKEEEELRKPVPAPVRTGLLTLLFG